jgi:large exoprotein involved in heme utilization and adhesion
LQLTNSQIRTGTAGWGNSGSIFLDATDNIALSNETLIAAIVLPGAEGRNGDITIQAGSLVMTGESTVNTGTAGVGDAGNISVSIRGAVSLTRDSNIFTNVVSLQQEFGRTATGNSGNIQLDAESLSLAEESTISTISFGTGNAGEISLKIRGALSLDNGNVTSGVGPGAVGDGRDLRIRARSLFLSNQSGISTDTSSQGNAGNLFLEIEDAIQLDNLSLISSSVRAGGIGRVGDITLRTRSLTLTRGSQIQTGVGRARDGFPAGEGLGGGTLRITTLDSATFSGRGFQGSPAGIFTDTDPGTSGRAGDVEITTGTFQLRDGTVIVAQTQNASEGGNITVRATTVDLANNANISSQSFGTGNAGSVTILAADTIRTNNSRITASANQSGGGSITLKAADIRLQNGSLINTNVAEGIGGGGNITITAPIFIALEDSDILANANQGRGGNITINSDAFLADFFSSGRATAVRYSGDIAPFRGNDRVDISASSAVGISGSVTIPDFSFLQNSLSSLSGNFVSPDQVVAGSCLARRNAEQGSFVVTGTGGLPGTPLDDKIPGRFEVGQVRSLDSTSQNTSSSQSPTPNSQPPTSTTWKLGDPIQEAQGLVTTRDGRMFLAANLGTEAIDVAPDLICPPEFSPEISHIDRRDGNPD